VAQKDCIAQKSVVKLSTLQSKQVGAIDQSSAE
jgi:hypothetical protein